MATIAPFRIPQNEYFFLYLIPNIKDQGVDTGSLSIYWRQYLFCNLPSLLYCRNEHRILPVSSASTNERRQRYSPTSWTGRNSRDFASKSRSIVIITSFQQPTMCWMEPTLMNSLIRTLPPYSCHLTEPTSSRTLLVSSWIASQITSKMVLLRPHQGISPCFYTYQ